MAADKSKRCQHRDAEVVRAYYDANGHYRRRHAFHYCHAPAAAVDAYGYGYCAEHRASGDFGYAPEPQLDAILSELLRRNH